MLRSRSVSSLLAVSLALALATPSSAQSKLSLDLPVKVKEWGYSIQPIKTWVSIPAATEDKFVSGQWKPNLDQAKQRGDYDAYQSGQLAVLQIIRIAPKVTSTPGGAKEPDSSPGEAEFKKTELGKNLDKKLNPKSLEDWIEGNYEGASKRWSRKPLKGSKMPGDLIEFGSGAQAITIGSFRHEGVEWGVVYTSFEETYRKNFQDIYTKSIASFHIFDTPDVDLAIAARKDPSKLKGDAKREALKASIAGMPGWYAIDKPHYVFLTNSDNRNYIEGLAKEIEMVREKVYTKLFPPRNTDESISPVRVLDKQSEYHQYGGPAGSAGYFSPDSGELVLFTKFEDVTKANSQAYCRSVMYHEAFHQYVHYAIGDISPHSWFNEGHGDYFAGMVVNGGSIVFDKFDWRVRFLKQHIREKRDLIPLRSLIRFPQREYYTNAGLKYSQGWALIYYLRSVTKNKRHQQALDIYFKHVADNIEAFRQKQKEKKGDDGKPEPVPGIPGIKIVNFEDREKVEKILSEAVDKAFEGIDLESLDKEFRAWVEKL